jgi:hypothetical protein
MSKMEQKLENNSGEDTLQNETLRTQIPEDLVLSFLDDEEPTQELSEPPVPLPIPEKARANWTSEPNGRGSF